ncbi:Cytochrome c551 OS=Ureibacillus acetophenoni OX=614649 GN=SAMN05877842_10784 PE=4 SV=1 [Ureibacillus acetophenoni]
MKKFWLALVLGSVLVLAACGGNDETTDNSDTIVDNNQGATDNTEDDNDATENNGDTSGDDPGEGTTDTETADSGSVAAGEKVVHQACISCHGANLEGMGNFPPLNNVGSRLSQEEILNVIQNGKGAMPANVVTGEDAENAAAYLATLK